MSGSVINSLAGSVYSICRMEPSLRVPPWSRPLLVASLIAYGLSEFGFVLLLEQPLVVAAAGGVMATLLLAALTTTALWLGGYSLRLNQTLIALAASGAVVGVINLALRLLLRTAMPPPLPLSMANLLLLPLFLWNLLIYAYVFRHALAGQPKYAFCLALGYLLLLYASMRELFRIAAG